MGKKGKKKGGSSDKSSDDQKASTSQQPPAQQQAAPPAEPVPQPQQPPPKEPVAQDVARSEQPQEQQQQPNQGKNRRRGKKQTAEAAGSQEVQPQPKELQQPVQQIQQPAQQTQQPIQQPAPQQRQQPTQQPAPQQQPGQGQQQQKGQGRGTPQQQQQAPAWGGRGQPPQQQQQAPAWGGRGQPPQQQQLPPGFTPSQPQQQRGRGQQQQLPPGFTPSQSQQQQQQPPPAWGGRGQPPQQQQHLPPGYTPSQPQSKRQEQRVRQTSEHSEGQRSTAGSEGSASYRSDPRDRTLSPTSSQGSVQGRGRGPYSGDGDRQRGAVGRGRPEQQRQEGSAVPQTRPQQQPGSSTQQQRQQQQQQPPQEKQPTARPSQQTGQQPKPDEREMPLQIVTKDMKRRGTLGRPLAIETNHLELTVKPKYGTAVHYDVTITPDKPKRLMRRVWEEYRKQYLPRSQAAFDDVKNAYSPAMLPFGQEHSGEVQVAEDAVSKPRTYKVVMKYAAMVNLTALFDYINSGGKIEMPQDALQCIDIVLRNVSAVRFVRVGRNYFSEPNRIVSLGDGLDLWYGYFQSAILGWKPFLNVDVAHKGFPTPQRVIDLMAQMTNARSPDEVDLRNDRRMEDTISKYLKGLKILYEIPNQPSSRRTFRVNSLVKVPGEAKFVLEGGEPTTVQAYFSKTKRFNLRYLNLPCLWVGPRDKKVYLPSELCTILPGQVVNKKLNEAQTSVMVKSAATSTQVRKDKIMHSLRQINFNDDPCVRAFGLSVGNDFEQIKARILDPPKIQYLNSTQMPSRGVWRADREKFLQPESFDNWTVLNLARNTRDDKIEDFVRMLENAARQQGMNVGRCTKPFERYEQRGPSTQGLQQIFTRLKSMKLVFVVVPDYPTDIYSKVKQVAELAVGCLTQCIKSKTMFKMNPATVGNILLKVNAKLNGMNHTIAEMSRPPCLKVPCMIMGADVTHPSPDQTDIPSVAAVAASYDATAAFKYNFCWRLQPARQEIITDLANIVKQQLMFFFSRTRQKPQRIIFYRDGVSEGQFRYVLNAEVQAIRTACASLGDGSFKPLITFLVVQKRHHTRFFPKDPGSREIYDQRNYNVPAGTLVDTDIIHPTAVEYYLVSHASIQGTARPTKYRVLWDDANMSDNEIQALTYYLCHMFTRCNRSVSYPAPTYYAHLAAFRARVYLEGHDVNLSNLQREQTIRIIKDELSVHKPMFFV